MASKKQIAANRRNAKRSTGPRSTEGKARSSMNATTHGLCSGQVLLAGEAPEEFRDVWQGVVEELHPQGEVEAYLAGRVAVGIWRMSRAMRIEAELFDPSPQGAAQDEPGIGDAFKGTEGAGGDPFTKLMRYEGSIDRGIQRALRELRTLRAVRRAGEADAWERALLGDDDMPAWLTQALAGNGSFGIPELDLRNEAIAPAESLPADAEPPEPDQATDPDDAAPDAAEHAEIRNEANPPAGPGAARRDKPSRLNGGGRAAGQNRRRKAGPPAGGGNDTAS